MLSYDTCLCAFDNSSTTLPDTTQGTTSSMEVIILSGLSSVLTTLIILAALSLPFNSLKGSRKGFFSELASSFAGSESTTVVDLIPVPSTLGSKPISKRPPPPPKPSHLASPTTRLQELSTHSNSYTSTTNTRSSLLSFLNSSCIDSSLINSSLNRSFNYLSAVITWSQSFRTANFTQESKRKIEEIKALSEHHEVAALLGDLIHKDGAGSWPPNANHTHSTWPVALQPYAEIYLELASLIPQAKPSLDDQVNITRIADFRARFRDMLSKRVDLMQVKQLLEAADAGRWEIFPRDVYNAFYCCIASSRHAFRWATIPVVQVAQLEKEIDLPAELIEPWNSLQRHFGCASESGNNMSNLVLNFDTQAKYTYRINTGMSPLVTSGEESFARIFYDVEVLGVPVYHDIAMAILTFARGDTAATARHVSSINTQLRFVLGSYLDNVHDSVISRSVWLSHVQGFYAWGVGHYDRESEEWVRYDGLSGNQVLLFQALDAFLGIEQYLSTRDQERNVPARQRALCDSIQKHSFRRELSPSSSDENEVQIVRDCDAIVKRLRMFRSAHRTRAKNYLSQPAPERLPMTAGKSVLEPTLDSSLEFLDSFMVKRLAQTI